ncbi:insulin-like 3 isoform X2 [Cebus imitator]|uniref:Insulin-like 3 n=1 Tax=Cebus imitator TaxID=2715852 RepID=A0A2K5QFD0_CEBIM|nr:insulin-like 3 isoform X2 [Cebus imitator]
MDPRLPAWALVLLGPALVFALGPAPTPEMREKLCGHHFVRALVRLCGGPRWSTEARRPVAAGDEKESHCVAWSGLKLLGSSDPPTLTFQSVGNGVSCCSGWRDDMCSMDWWPAVRPRREDLACSPCSRPLTATATAVQLPATLHTTAASVAVANKTC